MLTRATHLNQVTLCADGSMSLQWLKQIVDNDQVIFSEPHRTTVDFDGDVEKQVNAVSRHLVKMGYPPVNAGQIARVKAMDEVGRSDPGITKAREAKIAAKESSNPGGPGRS